jgi:hypothetical protein
MLTCESCGEKTNKPVFTSQGVVCRECDEGWMDAEPEDLEDGDDR